MESKNKGKNKNGLVSELRRDLVTGNWVVVAKARGNRPHGQTREPHIDDPIETCPFEDPKSSGNADPVLFYKDGDGEDWTLQVIPNKYPAFYGGGCPILRKVGPYSVQAGLGFHEVLITRDHEKHMALLDLSRVEEVFRAYKERFLQLKEQECVEYISIFHNHGRKAGASLTHPHSQIIAIPIIPSDSKRSLSGSSLFYRKHNKCVHCAMLSWEKKEDLRIVYQNDDFMAICPFISRTAYEVRIFPKNHAAYFEAIEDGKIPALADIFHNVLKKLYDKLDNPPYNFFLHTAPAGDKEYPQYHWHFEILPKLEVNAGFEISTGIEISTIEPEMAAKNLRD